MNAILALALLLLVMMLLIGGQTRPSQFLCADGQCFAYDFSRDFDGERVQSNYSRCGIRIDYFSQHHFLEHESCSGCGSSVCFRVANHDVACGAHYFDYDAQSDSWLWTRRFRKS